MIPLLLVVAGVVALVAGWIVLRRLGPRARVGRILAATSVIEVGRAIDIARNGQVRYVGVGGRVDADAPWDDAGGRPLVYERRVMERRDGDRWVTYENTVRSVPFEVVGALDRIAIDAGALGEGLVVVARESQGVAAEIPDHVPPGTPPETPIRLQVELVSAVDHALALGVPVMTDAGPLLRPGMGRPLILTTLEPAEAMRLLAEGRQHTAWAVSALLGGGLVALVAGLLWAVVDAAT